MKKFVLWFAVIAIVVLSCCLFMACNVSTTTQHPYENADKYLIGSQTYEVAELSALNIDWTVGKVVLVQDENATNVTVVEENNLDDKKKVHSYLHDGVLEIKFWQSGLKDVVDEKDKRLTVTYKSVQQLSIILTSGVLNAEKLTGDSATIKITSGDIVVNDAEFASLSVKMTSGDIRFGTIKADTVSFAQTSGNTYARSLDVNTFTSKSSSGDLDVGFASANSVSIKMTSGSAKVGIPTNGATLTFKKTSGSFKSDLAYTVDGDKYVFGDGGCDMSIKITSGSVRIKQS